MNIIAETLVSNLGDNYELGAVVIRNYYLSYTMYTVCLLKHLSPFYV